jgi:hypothetical protein
VTGVRPGVACALLLLASLTAARGASESARPDVDAMLREHFAFSDAQIADVHRGQPVAVGIPGSLEREIVVGGAVSIAAPAERLLAVFRDIERLEAGGGFLVTRRIGNPPRLQDFDDLTLPAEDVAALRRCRRGDCKVKLGERGFALLSQVDWRAADAQAQVQRFARRLAFETVMAYRARGSAALPATLDHRPPREVAAEFAEMVKGTRWLDAAMPGLRDYILRYPEAPRPAALEEYFYWSFVEFGLKKVLRLNHVVLYPLQAGGAARWALVNRQIYASHYFQNAMEVRLLMDDPATGGRTHYLLVMNVARPDGVTGLFGPLVRYKVRSGSRDALRKTLLGTKQRCEAPR